MPTRIDAVCNEHAFLLRLYEPQIKLDCVAPTAERAFSRRRKVCVPTRLLDTPGPAWRMGQRHAANLGRVGKDPTARPLARRARCRPARSSLA